jgi:superfamily II DNA/RNA helicase
MLERYVHQIGRTARTGATGAATIEGALSDETDDLVSK